MTLDHIKESVNALAESMQEMKQSMRADMDQLNNHMKKKSTVMSVSDRVPLSAKAEHQEESVRKDFCAFVRKGEHADLNLKSLTTVSDPQGGYMVPQVLSSKIVKTLADKSPFRSLASVTTISSDAIEFLVDRDAFEAGWATETGERKETNTAKLEKIKIAAHELYARPRATQKLLDDGAIDVEAWLSEKVADRLSQLENQAFFYGDGNGKPKGVFAYEAVEKDQWAWGKFEQIKTGKDGAFVDKNGADTLISVVERLKTAYHKGACWMVSPSALAAIRRLKDAQGHYLFQLSLEANKPPTLLGFPIYLCDEMPVLEAGKASTSMLFGNFQQAYQIIDRKQVTLMRDPYSAKPFVEFYTTKRVGGDVINFEALKMVRFEA